MLTNYLCDLLQLLLLTLTQKNSIDSILTLFKSKKYNTSQKQNKNVISQRSRTRERQNDPSKHLRKSRVHSELACSASFWWWLLGLNSDLWKLLTLWRCCVQGMHPEDSQGSGGGHQAARVGCWSQSGETGSGCPVFSDHHNQTGWCGQTGGCQPGLWRPRDSGMDLRTHCQKTCVSSVCVEIVTTCKQLLFMAQSGDVH